MDFLTYTPEQQKVIYQFATLFTEKLNPKSSQIVKNYKYTSSARPVIIVHELLPDYEYLSLYNHIIHLIENAPPTSIKEFTKFLEHYPNSNPRSLYVPIDPNCPLLIGKKDWLLRELDEDEIPDLDEDIEGHRKGLFGVMGTFKILLSAVTQHLESLSAQCTGFKYVDNFEGMEQVNKKWSDFTTKLANVDYYGIEILSQIPVSDICNLELEDSYEYEPEFDNSEFDNSEFYEPEFYEPDFDFSGPAAEPPPLHVAGSNFNDPLNDTFVKIANEWGALSLAGL